MNKISWCDCFFLGTITIIRNSDGFTALRLRSYRLGDFDYELSIIDLIVGKLIYEFIE